MRRSLAIVGFVLFALAACSSAGVASPTTSPAVSPPRSPTETSAGTPGQTSGYQVATGPTNVILRMATSGGFVAPGFLLSRLPDWTLFGDGRVMIPASYTGNIPVVPQLIVTRLGPPEIQKIVAAADKAGLLGPDASFDAVGIADAGTTVFTTVVGSRVHIISAYALGMTQTVDTTPAGVERAKLADFQNELLNLPSFLDRSFGSELFEPAGLRVFLTDAGPADASQPTPRTIAWPLASDPAKVAQQTAVPGTTCVAVIGADVATFEAAARNADGQTVWTYGSARYSLGVRPMFPNETGCAGGTL